MSSPEGASQPAIRQVISMCIRCKRGSSMAARRRLLMSVLPSATQDSQCLDRGAALRQCADFHRSTTHHDSCRTGCGWNILCNITGDWNRPPNLSPIISMGLSKLIDCRSVFQTPCSGAPQLNDLLINYQVIPNLY